LIKKHKNKFNLNYKILKMPAGVEKLLVDPLAGFGGWPDGWMGGWMGWE
jgi:hypothetical protein